jgi:quinol-cytochrome oxidoreductase complex cytochrome b subunit
MSALPPLDVVDSADPLETPRRVALVRPDIRPEVRRREERWVMTFPHLIVREVILFQIVVIALALAAILFDAPLLGIANPLETPNPAKAPWYFLGLQELLHYFPPVVAGVLMPTLAVLALAVIPYARVNLNAGPLWAARPGRTAVAVAAVTVFLVALFAAFACWPIAVPTILIATAIFAARGGETGGRLRRRLARVTLPEWIMTWFVVIATILTVIGTFFRGPGWSLVWPWDAAVFG